MNVKSGSIMNVGFDPSGGRGIGLKLTSRDWVVISRGNDCKYIVMTVNTINSIHVARKTAAQQSPRK